MLQVVGSLGRQGRRPGCLNSPTALGVDSQGRVLVADTGNDRVTVLAPEPGEAGEGAVQGGELATGLSAPGGLAVSEDGRLVAVADTGHNRQDLFYIF